MPTTSIRIRKSDHAALRKMAAEDELSLTEELGRIIEEKRRERFIRAANEEMAAMEENDPEAWESLKEEDRLLDAMPMDGIEDWPWEEKDEH